MTHINRILRDELDHFHLLFLTDSISSISGLSIIVRIEILVVDDHNRSGSQVDTHSSSFSRQEEDGNLLVVRKLVDQRLPLVRFRLSVKTSKLDAEVF